MGCGHFSLYNKKNGDLILCRDRLGVKPLYYYISKNNFVFGSELKSLCCHSNFVKKV